MTFARGDTIVLQEVLDGRVWAARPQVVVEDDGDLLMTWFPKGSGWKVPTTPPGQPRPENRGLRLARCAASGEWVFRDVEWDVDTLAFTRPGDWFSIWVSWPPSGEDWGWYVNLQRPFRRTSIGIETMDLALDVLIAQDRSFRWKDEDELELFVRHGVFSEDLAAHVRAQGLRVVERAQRNESPFDESWRETWRPDSSWSLPALPDGWDRVCR